MNNFEEAQPTEVPAEVTAEGQSTPTNGTPVNTLLAQVHDFLAGNIEAPFHDSPLTRLIEAREGEESTIG